MKREEDKKKNRRKTFHSLCSVSALLLSVVCCMAVIHVELRIQEHHRLMSHSETLCDQMETQMMGLQLRLQNSPYFCVFNVRASSQTKGLERG